MIFKLRLMAANKCFHFDKVNLLFLNSSAGESGVVGRQEYFVWQKHF